ncbi:MAG: hypothetical protein LBK04_04065 [Clostridiales Family XIII bacterium]|jgi:hypothetical protein|nr:hypothetical protein [Clostridiales Family XIII bacterium]
MKQMIVLLATIILGIALAGMVMSFGDTAKGVTDSTKSRLEAQLGWDEE